MKLYRELLALTMFVYSGWMFAGQVCGLPLLVFAVILVLSSRVVWRDALLWCGLAFLLLVGVQTIRSGAVSECDPAGGVWIDVSKAVWWNVFSVRRAESFEMLVWFGPMIVLASMLRKNVISNLALERLVIISGVFLGAYGLIDRYYGNGMVYSVFPWRAEHFAGFTYINNAGDYFLLMLGLTLGSRVIKPWFKLGCIVFFLWVIWVVDCRVVKFMSIVLMIVSTFIWIRASWREHLLCGTGIIAVFCMVYGGAIRAGWLDRVWQWRLLFETWKHHWLFGVGGWGCRYFPSLYILPECDPQLLTQPVTHCDALQYICEFGIVGFLLLATCWILLWRSRSDRFAPGIVAVLLVMVHSLIDCPLRCPAVLLLLVLVMVGIERKKTHE